MEHRDVVVRHSAPGELAQRTGGDGGIEGDAVELHRLVLDREPRPWSEAGVGEEMHAFRETKPPVHRAPVGVGVVGARHEDDRHPRLGQLLQGGLDLEDEALVGIVRVEEVPRDHREVHGLLRRGREFDRAKVGAQEIARPLQPVLPHGRERGPEVQVGEMQDPDAHRLLSLERACRRSIRRRSLSASRCERKAIGRGR